MSALYQLVLFKLWKIRPESSKNEEETETRCNEFLDDFVSRINSLEFIVAGHKQEIIDTLKSELIGVSAQVAASEEWKLNVILLNVKEGDSSLKDYDMTKNHFWA